nr:immunoglobulin light chain junction region [Macaca mulatta]
DYHCGSFAGNNTWVF